MFFFILLHHHASMPNALHLNLLHCITSLHLTTLIIIPHFSATFGRKLSSYKATTSNLIYLVFYTSKLMSFHIVPTLEETAAAPILGTPSLYTADCFLTKRFIECTYYDELPATWGLHI